MPSPTGASHELTRRRELRAPDSGVVAGEGAPVNDDCANALEVSDGVISFSTELATTDGPDERTACAGSAVPVGEIDADIWYEYTATCDGTLTLDFCLSEYDTKVAVYSGCGVCPFPDDSAIACNDDSLECDGTKSFLRLGVDQGVCYTIRVGGWSNDRGAGSMSIVCIPPTGACCSGPDCVGTLTQGACDNLGGTWFAGTNCAVFSCPVDSPANDECPDCAIVQTNVPYDGTTIGSDGNDRPSSCGSNDLRDTWHCWTADCTGITTISLCDSTFDTTLAVFDACDGIELGCDDDECFPASELSIAVTAGETFVIRVAGYEGDFGDYTLNVDSCEVACCRDDGFCALRTPEVCTSVGGTPGAQGQLCLGDFDGNARDDACEIDPWVWLDHNDDAQGGYLPDFDQNLDFDNGDGEGDPSTGAEAYYDGPVAATNSLMWLDRRFPGVGIVSAGVTPATLVGALAERLATNGQTPSPYGHGSPYLGTFVDDMQLGLRAYLIQAELADLFDVRTIHAPTFEAVAGGVVQGHTVILLLGFYRIEDVLDVVDLGFQVDWRRIGGHFVTVAGADAVAKNIALSDPDTDAAEEGAAGEVRGVDHDHDFDGDPGTTPTFRDENFDHAVHDDENLASHDIYVTLPSFAPAGDWVLAVDGDQFAYADALAPFHLEDAGGAFDAGRTIVLNGFLSGNGLPDPAPDQVYSVVEYAVIVSPDRVAACCAVDGSCDDVSPVDCVLAGDVPAGPGTRCLGDGNMNGPDDVCEACPAAGIVDEVPRTGTIDARQPSGPVGDYAKRGIGAPGHAGSMRHPILVTLDPPIQGAEGCFELCETVSDPLLGENSIQAVRDLGDGIYEIVLEHAIHPGDVTTIVYEGGARFVFYLTHPGNVDGSSFVTLSDITTFVDCCLDEACEPALPMTRCDIDRSGSVTPADLVRLIDVIAGGGAYERWLDTPRPITTTCP